MTSLPVRLLEEDNAAAVNSLQIPKTPKTLEKLLKPLPTLKTPTTLKAPSTP